MEPQYVSRLVYQSADRVICVSEHVREQVLQGTASSKTVVIYNGADPELFAPAAQGAGATESQKILSIGNLIPIKGHEALIRAIAALIDQHPGVMLDIVGDGPLRDELGALTKKLGIADRTSSSFSGMAQPPRGC